MWVSIIAIRGHWACGTPSADSETGMDRRAGMVTEVVRPWVTAKFDDAQPGAWLVIVMLRAEMFPFGMVIGVEPGLVKVRFSGWLVPGYSSAVRSPPTPSGYSGLAESGLARMAVKCAARHFNNARITTRK